MANLKTLILFFVIALTPACDVIEDESPDNDSSKKKNLDQCLDSSLQLVPVEATNYPRDYVPFQHWPKLGATSIGLLYASGDQEWGGSYNHGQQIATGTARQEYKFTPSEYSSPYALYFESQGEGCNYIPNWSVDTASGPRKYDAAMFLPGTTNRFGLNQSIHLVKLTVNDGIGGGGGVHFVATDVEILEGTPGYEINPVATMADARARFDAFQIKTQDWREKFIERTFEQLKSTMKDAPTSHDEYDVTKAVGVYPRWIGEKNEMHVMVAERQTVVYSEVVPFEGDFVCPDGAPCAGPPEFETKTYSYEIEIGIVLAYDAKGTFLYEFPLDEYSQIGSNLAVPQSINNDEVYDHYDDGLLGDDQEFDDVQNNNECAAN